MAMKIQCPRCREHSDKKSLKDGSCPNCCMPLENKSGKNPAEKNYFQNSALDILSEDEEIVDLGLENEIKVEKISSGDCILCDDFRLHQTTCPHCGNVFMNI